MLWGFLFVQATERCRAEQSLTRQERDHTCLDFVKYKILQWWHWVWNFNTAPSSSPAVGQHQGVFAQQGYLPRLRMLQAQGGLSGATGPREPRGNFDTDPKSTRQIQILWKPTSRSRQEGTLERCFQHWMTDLRWLRAGHTNTTSLLPLWR